MIDKEGFFLLEYAEFEGFKVLIRPITLQIEHGLEVAPPQSLLHNHLNILYSVLSEDIILLISILIWLQRCLSKRKLAIFQPLLHFKGHREGIPNIWGAPLTFVYIFLLSDVKHLLGHLPKRHKSMTSLVFVWESPKIKESLLWGH